MTKQCPVGVFDSGVGGLTVVQQISQQIPEGRIIYFGDTAHVPYGARSSEELICFADKICQFLLDQGAEVIVDACNSTSAVALDFLKEKYTIPIIGVIEPGLEAAISQTRNGRIGVIATEATIKSDAHKDKAKKRKADVLIVGQACPLFVPLVESGKVTSQEAYVAAKKYLEPLQKADIDTLVLGCTHYPFLAPVLQEILGPDVTVVDPAVETVRQLKLVVDSIEKHDTISFHEYFVSGDAEVFQQVGEKLIGHQKLPKVKQVSLNWGD